MSAFTGLGAFLIAFGCVTTTAKEPSDGARIVRLVPECSPGFFVGLPSYMNGDKKMYIVGLAVDGDPAILEDVKAKIAKQNWQSGTVTPPSRPMMLSIPAREKTATEVFELFGRLSKGEFGKVTVHPMLEAEPTKKCGATD